MSPMQHTDIPDTLRVTLPRQSVLAAKRAFDIVCSALGLTILSPLFAAIALAVRCTSPGGVLFRQTRIGRGKKPFTIYKFRTMEAASTGLHITVGGDARITGVGRALRRYKLDELPQLFNVLKGDMSFVGPRPEVEEYTRLYDAVQQQVFLVRPGITCSASIAFYNESELLRTSSDPNRTYIETIMPRKLELCLADLRSMSFLYDLGLIFKTLRTSRTKEDAFCRTRSEGESDAPVRIHKERGEDHASATDHHLDSRQK